MKRITLFLIIPSIFYISAANLEPFLYFSHEINTDNVILEGWLKAGTLDHVHNMLKKKDMQGTNIYVLGWYFPWYHNHKEINKHKIKKIQNPNDGIRLIVNGTIESHLKLNTRTAGSDSYPLILKVKGSAVDNITSHFAVFLNKEMVYSGFCDSDTTTVQIPVKTTADHVHLAITFGNDTRNDQEDRNFSLLSLKHNDQELLTTGQSWQVFYEDAYKYKGYYGSNSAFVQTYLTDLGIDLSNIKTIDKHFERRNKTHFIARHFGTWLSQQEDNMPENFNIITSDTHARRSYLAFRRQMPGNSQVGVIPIPSYQPYSNKITRAISLGNESARVLITWLFYH